jgi:RHS repeat-associated protein
LKEKKSIFRLPKMGCLKLNIENPTTLKVLNGGKSTNFKSRESVYLYGYQGSEKDDEIKGNGNSYTTFYRALDPRLGRWFSIDPKTKETPFESPYVSMGNNPIWYNDILGDKPTPKEAAAMSAHVYGDKSDKILKGGWKVSDKKIDGVVLRDGETGLYSKLYERTIKKGEHKGEIEYVYATAGTQDAKDAKDAKEDALQPLGLSSQYDLSVKNAKQISKSLGKNTELTFTGHSLGGGEAAANAYATGRDAITFNAAGVGSISLLKYGQSTKSKIDAYILSTDPLNLAQNKSYLLPDVNGTRHYLKPSDLSSVYNGHSIDNVLKNFDIDPTAYQRHGSGGSW